MWRYRSCGGEQPFQRASQLRWAWGHRDSSRLHRRDLARRIALAARDDCPGVAHPPPGRRGPAGDEAYDRFATPAFRFVGEKLRGVLLGAPADLADHHDRFGLVVGEEHLQNIDEVVDLDLIIADADRGRLAKPFDGSLDYRFVSQCTRAADHADGA